MEATVLAAQRSDQPAAVAHQLAAFEFVHLAPGMDPARADAEPAVRCGLRAGRSRCARRTGHPAPAAARRSRGSRLRPRSWTRRGWGPAPAEPFGWRPGSCRLDCPPAWPAV